MSPAPVVNPHFGNIGLRTDVVDALEATLKLWEEEYLAEIERQTGRDAATLPRIMAWERSNSSIKKHVGASLPCVVIRCIGLADEPTRRKAGTTVRWAAMVSVVCRGTDQADTEELASTYTAAFRALLEHNRTLGGVASSLTWVDETYGEMPEPDRDTLGAGTIILTIEMDNVVKSRGGPSGDPLPDPYGTVRDANPTVVDGGVTTTVTPTTEIEETP